MKADWEIARDAETQLKTAAELGAALGLEPQELLPSLKETYP